MNKGLTAGQSAAFTFPKRILGIQAAGNGWDTGGLAPGTCYLLSVTLSRRWLVSGSFQHDILYDFSN